jgi:hypothetical protein
MLDVRLKNTEKSEIFVLVQQAGMNPADFKWTDEESTECASIEAVQFKISVLTHHPTEYFCKFAGYWIEFSPGPNERVENSEHHDNWVRKRDTAKLWLRELRKEMHAPDLWASIIDEKSLSTAASATVDNQPFTAAEQHLIDTKLDQIKGHILEGQQFAADQVELVEERFAYFEESSKRMGRKDWLNVLYGGLITVIVGVALAPDVAKSLLRLAAAAFQSLWGMAQGQLP